MKNELGIEICGENCKGDVIPNYDCPKCGQEKCGDESCQYFAPKTKSLKQRIKELQEQQFTREELNTIIDALQMAKEEFAFCPEEKTFDEILKKIEQTFKNSESNLKEQE